MVGFSRLSWVVVKGSIEAPCRKLQGVFEM